MLSAFQAEPIIELKQRDKSKIESILAHGDNLLVGLNTGCLRIYRTRPQTDDDVSDDPDRQTTAVRKTDLLREYEAFSKAKIEQLAVFKEANIVISLSGGQITLHDLVNYEVQEQLGKTKGASTFAVTSNIVNDVTTGVPGLVSRLAVAVKRKLLIWSWQDGEANGDVQEIALASVIRTLSWSTGTNLLAGLQSGYVMVDISTSSTKPIYGPGSIGGDPEQDTSKLGGVGTGTMSYFGMGGMVPDPLATGLGETEMLLARDINSHFIERNGDPVNRRQVPWKTAPHSVGYSYPFLLSLHDPSKGLLEVRNPQTLTLLQTIPLSGAMHLQVPNPNISLAHQGKGFLVASERVVWRMNGLEYDAQIDSLVESARLDEAISLLEMVEETLVKDKTSRLREIKMQKAQRLFDEKSFRDALELFGEVSAPPERVIVLFPPSISGLASSSRPVPSSPAKKHKKTSSIASTRSSLLDSEEWNERDLKAAVRELQAFLAECRRRLQRFFDSDQNVKDIAEVQRNSQAEDIQQVTEYLLGIPNLDDVDISKRLVEVATLVDTTLFRAHMFATPSLAGSLFRIANFCDPDVVMSKLESSERHNDLIGFLYGKGLHRQALEKLRSLGMSEATKDVDEQLYGPVKTVNYLQNLSPENIDLILEFAKWPMESNPELGMQIFVADTQNADDLPRSKVSAFLEAIHKSLAIKYLERVIDELDDMTPELHQKLLILYLEALTNEKTETSSETLAKFLSMLKASEQYSPATVSKMLPKDDSKFYEANAIVYSKMGHHKQALYIYVFDIQDMQKAEEYCNQVHLEETIKAEKKASQHKSAVQRSIDEELSIYHTLLSLYLTPPKGQKPRIGPAIELMARHGPRLPASSTLEMIPGDLLIRELEFYFRGRVRNATTAMSTAKITAGLRSVENDRLKAVLLVGEANGVPQSNCGRLRNVRIDDERVCGVCYKRLGNSVISVFPDNSVVHLNCATRRQGEIAAN